MERPEDRDNEINRKIYKVRATLVSTTNKKFNYLTGHNGVLTYGIGISGYFDMWTYYLYTSNIQDIKENEENDEIILHTLNSMYIFRKENYES